MAQFMGLFRREKEGELDKSALGFEGVECDTRATVTEFYTHVIVTGSVTEI